MSRASALAGARRATLLALLGQNAVPWGAMAIGTLIGAELTGLTVRQMGVGSAWLNAPPAACDGPSVLRASAAS